MLLCVSCFFPLFQVVDMQKDLDLKNINIIQIPLDFYPFALPEFASRSPTPSRGPKISFHTSKLKVARASATKKGATFSLNFTRPSYSPSPTSQYLYTMENHAAILMQLENEAIQLKLHIASPHVGALRQRANKVLDTVSQLQELVHLLTKCQEQVKLMIQCGET